MSEKPADKPAPAPAPAATEKKRLSYKEKREFELLEKEMEELTKEKSILTEKINGGYLPFDELQRLSVRAAEVSQLLDEKELRWLELSEAVS
jgi:ATP-binding cassette subfamily F protein uup